MKSLRLPMMLVAVCLTSAMAMPMRARAAETELPTSYYVLTVDMQIIPGQIENFRKAIEENSAASIKEPGCLQFHVSASTTDPNHIFLYEIYENEAAYQTHRTTEHFKKFDAIRNTLIVKSEAKPFKPIALHEKK